MSHPIISAAEPVAAISLLSWSAEPAVILPVVAAATIYWRGFTTCARRMPARFGPRQVTAFLGGLATLVIALCSPIDPLSQQLLSAHMVQHLLLMLVAPPLLWLGAPVAPLLLGLPRPIRHAVARALAVPPIRHGLVMLTHPATSLAAFIITFWVWHVPALYELALTSDLWHHVEHICFVSAALFFWRPVVLAWPARSPWPRFGMIPYLIMADFQNTVLSALLAFSDHVIYPFYGTLAGRGGLSPLDDQAIAGAIMWAPGSVPFLLPILCLVVRALAAPSPEDEPRAIAVESEGQPVR